MNAAIATHLNILESAIIRIEEWANVVFVVAKGIGARFVSKKVVKVENMEDMEDALLEIVRKSQKLTNSQAHKALADLGLVEEWGGMTPTNQAAQNLTRQGKIKSSTKRFQDGEGEVFEVITLESV